MTPLLFYCEWPLTFHNPEAERKARALRGSGYDVVYCAGIGLRNPRLRTIGKAFVSTRRALRERPGAREADVGALRTLSPLVVPPRQLPGLKRVNVAWLARQVGASIEPAEQSLAWVRYPTPELVSALAELRPRAIVYECVDPHHLTSGVSGRWVSRFEAAEQRLISLADTVVVPGEALGDLFRATARSVEVIPHGVEIELFEQPGASRGHSDSGAQTVAGFVGTLDFRLDIEMLRRSAEDHPQWLFRLIGPVREGFDPRRLSDLTNVRIEAPIPQADLGKVLATFDVGLMPYRDSAHYAFMCPVKNLEFMAAGRPAVARPNRALAEYSDLLYFAGSPAEFSAQLDHAVAEDSAQLARRRREAAEANTWERRLREVVAVAQRLAPIDNLSR